MSPKSFALLLLATMASVGLAIAAVVDRDLPTASVTAGRPLAPGLGERLADVARIVVEAKSQTMTVERREAGWVLVEKGGYPVDPAKVRELVLAVASAALVEPKTAAADRLPRLELERPADDKAKSKSVRIATADGAELAAIIVGKTKYGLYGAGRAGVYVREADKDQAWLADRTITVPDEPADWLNRTVIDLPAASITGITLGEGGANPVQLIGAASAAGVLTLATVPEGREADAEKISRVTSLLSSLTMQDVRPASELAFDQATPRAKFTTTGGAVIGATLLREGEGDDAANWVRFIVTEPAQAPAGAPAAADAAPTPPGATAAELAMKLNGWAFKLPKYLADRLTWQAQDLLKPADKTS